MTGRHVVVVGAGRLGCEIALAAQGAGFRVTLIDEHPQALKAMSFDAPYFYGAGLPAGLSDEAAMLDNVLGSDPLLMECIEQEVDLKIGTIAWGEFHDAPNRQHIGTPKVAIVSQEGNDLIDYDHLVLATGARDFVPSFTGWDLPSVCGVKAAEILLSRYQCFNGTRALVLGSGPLAVAVARLARERGVEIAGLVEPSATFGGTDEDAAWLEAEGIPQYRNAVILSANGTDRVTSATLVSTLGDGAETEIACDTICVAIATLPNVELPSAMGCEMVFAEPLSAWVPQVSRGLETSVPGVFWVSPFTGTEDQVDRVMAALEGGSDALPDLSPLAEGSRAADEARLWTQWLHETGGENVVLCQCEGVTRGEFLAVEPPRYLGGSLRQPKSHQAAGPTGPRVNQDLAKRMTRVGMGHCQGKRCRDEAALMLALRFGIPVRDIKPGTYRFPVRPLDMELIAAPEGDAWTSGHWQNWPEPKELRAGGGHA